MIQICDVWYHCSILRSSDKGRQNGLWVCTYWNAAYIGETSVWSVSPSLDRINQLKWLCSALWSPKPARCCLRLRFLAIELQTSVDREKGLNSFWLYFIKFSWHYLSVVPLWLFYNSPPFCCVCSPSLMVCKSAMSMTSFPHGTRQRRPRLPIATSEYYTDTHIIELFIQGDEQSFPQSILKK